MTPANAVPQRPPTTLATAANPPPLLKITEVARRLGVSRSMAYRLTSDGVIPTVRYRRMVRVSPSELESWIAGHAA